MPGLPWLSAWQLPAAGHTCRFHRAALGLDKGRILAPNNPILSATVQRLLLTSQPSRHLNPGDVTSAEYCLSAPGSSRPTVWPSRGAGVDDLAWREAVQRAGGPDNPDRLWPVLAAGLTDLRSREAAQVRWLHGGGHGMEMQRGCCAAAALTAEQPGHQAGACVWASAGTHVCTRKQQGGLVLGCSRFDQRSSCRGCNPTQKRTVASVCVTCTLAQKGWMRC